MCPVTTPPTPPRRFMWAWTADKWVSGCFLAFLSLLVLVFCGCSIWYILIR